MAKKKKTNFILRTSVWSRFSIWWGFVFFMLLIPGIMFLFSWEYDTYMSGLAEHVTNLKISGINNAADYQAALKEGALTGTQVYSHPGFIGNLFGIPLIEKLFIGMGISFATMKLINIFALIIGIFTLLFALLSFGSKIIRTVKTTYTFKGNTIVSTTGHLFFKDEEIRRILYTPGMDVSVKQTLKGKIFNYGDLRLSLGYGDAGEVYMKGVRKPLKAKKKLLALINKKCSVMPEHGYTMNPYNAMYNVIGR